MIRRGRAADRAGHSFRWTRVCQCETLIVVSNEVFSGGADYAGDTDRYLLALAQVNNALAPGPTRGAGGVRHPCLL